MLEAKTLKTGAWCVHGLLSKQECADLVQTGMERGLEKKEATSDIRYRNASTLILEDKQQLAERIWARLKHIVPQEYCIEDTASPPEGFKPDSVRDMQGRWTPCNINQTFLLSRYRGGGHFGPHRDSYRVFSKNTISLLTVLIYLTDRPPGHGGATNLLRDEMDSPFPDGSARIRAPEGCVEVRVEADEAGKALVFQHDLLHEGETLPLDAEPKWVLITQVLYQRDPESVPQFTPDQEEARRFLALAEQAEVDGDLTGAMRLYNKAYRLDPSLELNH